MDYSNYARPVARPMGYAGMLAAALLLAAVPASAQSNAVKRKAEQWIGRDAGELLLRYRVDGGNAIIVEDDATGQTTYTWETYRQAYTETVVVPNQVIGMHGRVPIYDNSGYSYDVDHPTILRCRVTYTADLEGIIRSWETSGFDCSRFVLGPR